MKPIIGVMPLVDKERESYWMLPGYFHCLEEAGAIPLMLPLTQKEEDIKELLSLTSGLLFTGGHDVDPRLYGEAPHPTTDICQERDNMEKICLTQALTRDIPCFGICRGLQFFNAYWGGSLWQDLPSQRPGDIDHHQKPPYHLPAHKVKVFKDTPLHTILNQEEIEVNSYHHQAIKDLAPALEPMAEAKGLVEAAVYPQGRFVMAVQWHPEFSHTTDVNSKKLIKAFVNACTY